MGGLLSKRATALKKSQTNLPHKWEVFLYPKTMKDEQLKNPNTATESNPLKEVGIPVANPIESIFAPARELLTLEPIENPKPNHLPFKVVFAQDSELARVEALAKAKPQAELEISEADAEKILEFRKMTRNLELIAQVALINQSNPERVIVNEMIQPKNSIRIAQKIETNPNVFEDPTQTAQFNLDLDFLHSKLFSSGVWVMFATFFGDNPFDRDQFVQKITSLDPELARLTVQQMAAKIDEIERTKIISDKDRFAQNAVRQVKNAGSPQEPQVPKAKIAQVFGIPDNVLPSSVLGVATALGHREGNPIVLTLGEKNLLDKQSVFNYGTTDFANPVEAIMLAVAASRENQDGTTSVNTAFYDTDPDAHTVKSYLERVLIPSILSTLDLDSDSLERIKNNVAQLPETTDIELDVLEGVVDSQEFSLFLTRLKTLSQKSPKTFTELYLALNRQLTEKLGIFHIPSNDFFTATQATIEDITSFGEVVSLTSKASFDEFNLRIIDSGFDDNTKTGFARGIFGNGPWDVTTRKLVRPIDESEPEVDVFELEGDILLSELKDIGLTLGGNGWALLLQQLETYFDTPVVIAHKNTALGSNYVAPLAVGQKTKALVSPIVRVIPGGAGAGTGDGLDIGFYLEHPELISIVKNAYLLEDGDFQGGKQKAVIEVAPYKYWVGGVANAGYKVTTSLEATTGGNGKRQHITSQVITK